MNHEWTWMGAGVQEWIWIGVGFSGQVLFFMRFFVQWLASEREGASVIPIAFWYFSLAGGAVLTVYAGLYRRDPVIFLGQIGGMLIYGRNLALVYRGRRQARATTAARVHEPHFGQTVRVES